MSVETRDVVGAVLNEVGQLLRHHGCQVFANNWGVGRPPAGNVHDGGHVHGFDCIQLHACSCKLRAPCCHMLHQGTSTRRETHTLEDVLQRGIVEAPPAMPMCA